MPRGNPKCSDEEFINLFKTLNIKKIAHHLDTSERAVGRRRRRLEHKFGITISPSMSGEPVRFKYPGRINIKIQNGQVLIGSDFHIWPGEVSTCLRAFKKFVSDIKPDVVILNGDVMDFPTISKYAQSWEKAPDVWEELEAAQDHLSDIVKRCKRGSRKIWTLGNHDARFEAKIANSAPQMKKVKGVHLSDHFPLWEKAMSCMINEGIPGGATMIKHIPQKGGVNSTRTSTLNAGVSTISGHLHAQNVRPYSDYAYYDRYGVDGGMVADKEHPAFAYTNDNCLDWRSGFPLLTYQNTRLLYPELITKWSDDAVQFRGEIISV